MRAWIESPYAGDVERNLAYLHECARWLVHRDMEPMCSHGWFTQFLNDDDPKERERGIIAGFKWQSQADCLVVCTRYGLSEGMKAGIDHWIHYARRHPSSIHVLEDSEDGLTLRAARMSWG